jgi:hypothetical protein
MNLQRSGARRPATYQDVLDAPRDRIAEIIRGALHLQPRPAMPHGFAGSSLGMEIGGPFQKGRGGPGGWWIVFEPELHLGDEIVVPDLAGWRREADAAVSARSAFTSRAGLGVRNPVALDARDRCRAEAGDLSRAWRHAGSGWSIPTPARWRPSRCATGMAGDRRR